MYFTFDHIAATVTVVSLVIIGTLQIKFAEVNVDVVGFTREVVHEYIDICSRLSYLLPGNVLLSHIYPALSRDLMPLFSSISIITYDYIHV